MALIAVKYMPKASDFLPKLWSIVSSMLGGGLGAVTEILFMVISLGRGVDSMPSVYLLRRMEFETVLFTPMICKEMGCKGVNPIKER